MDTTQKVVPLHKIGAIADELRREGKKIVTTNGAFDILHVGHKRALEESRALGDVLIVGVNSDASVKEYKSETRPIIPEAERAEMLAAFACVDYVTIFDESDPRNFLEIVKPDVHTKGAGYDPDALIEAETVKRNGGVIVSTPQSRSTTEIIEAIKRT